jgi:hypothetical protein
MAGLMTAGARRITRMRRERLGVSSVLLTRPSPSTCISEHRSAVVRNPGEDTEKQAPRGGVRRHILLAGNLKRSPGLAEKKLVENLES